MKQMEIELPLARSTDPQTSHDGGQNVQMRAGSQRAVLLSAYAGEKEGLTATQAALKVNVSLESCYWKRCSELRQAGFIEALVGDGGLPVTRKNPRSGSHQEVNVITDKGLAWLENNK